jgi:hypothetical protein
MGVLKDFGRFPQLIGDGYTRCWINEQAWIQKMTGTLELKVLAVGVYALVIFGLFGPLFCLISIVFLMD